MAVTLKRRILLELLRKGVVRRKEIVESFGVAKSTLSYAIRDLRQEGKIDVLSERKGRGRPSEIVRLSPKAWKIVGVKIGREAVIGVLMDATLKEIKRTEEKVFHGMRNISGYTMLLERILEELVTKKVAAIGISVSGNVENGVVVDSPMLNINGLDLKEILKKNFSGTVSIMSDVQALSVHESFKYGGDRFLIVNYGLGIGACWCESGKNRVLPIGHIVVDRSGEMCYCGQRGCLETVASDYANLKAFTHGDFTITEFVEYEHERYEDKLLKLWELSKKEPEKVRKIYDKSLDMLSMVIGNLVVLFQPEKVSFYGEGIAGWMVNEVEERVKLNFKRQGVEKVRFHFRGEDDAFEKGAAFKAAVEFLREEVKV